MKNMQEVLARLPKIKPIVAAPAGAPSAKHITDANAALANAAKGAAQAGRFAVRFHDANGETHCFDFSKDACKVAAGKWEKFEAGIVTDKATWMRILSGAVSPLEAFYQGKFEFHGSQLMGKRLLAKLAGVSEDNFTF